VFAPEARGPDTLETVLPAAPPPSRERWTGLRLGPDRSRDGFPGLHGVAISIRRQSLRRVHSPASRARRVYVPLGPLDP